jgi:hypothetical protein
MKESERLFYKGLRDIVKELDSVEHYTGIKEIQRIAVEARLYKKLGMLKFK